MPGYLLRKDDFPSGITTAADVQKLAALLNPYLTALNALTAQGVTLSDNVSAEVQIGTFAHGLAQQFTLKKLTSAKGCLVLGCDSAVVRSAPLMRAVLDSRPNALPRVSVTVWFDDPTVLRATVALLFTPEGQLCTSPPAVPAAWQTPALLNSYTASRPVGYFMDSSGFVHLRGTVTGGLADTIFTLPAGYRPSQLWIFSTDHNSGTYGRVVVNTNGNVDSDLGLHTFAVLDGISFDTR